MGHHGKSPRLICSHEMKWGQLEEYRRKAVTIPISELTCVCFLSSMYSKSPELGCSSCRAGLALKGAPLLSLGQLLLCRQVDPVWLDFSIFQEKREILFLH